MKPSPGDASPPLPIRVAVPILPGAIFCVIAAIFFAIFPPKALGGGLPGSPVTMVTNAPKSFQSTNSNTPARSPDIFNPDPGSVSPTNKLALPPPGIEVIRTTNNATALPPTVFNPDPGAAFITKPVVQPLYTNDFGRITNYNGQAVPPDLALPRTNLYTTEIVGTQATNPPPYGSESLAPGQKLPRRDTVSNKIIPHEYDYQDYPLARRGMGYPANAVPETNRWRIGFVPWRRYTGGITETPYETPTPYLWHPYQQSLLKGDAPIIGQDIFLDLTASTETLFEGRRVPTSSGISASQPGSAEFYGQSEEISVVNNFSFSLDFFKGDTAFRPVDWAIHLQPVYDINYLRVHEAGVVSPDPRGFSAINNTPPPNNGGVENPGDVGNLLTGQLNSGPQSQLGHAATTRTKEYLALQEAFGEVRLADLSDNFDFLSLRLGTQPFNADFRGFLFNDVNTGLRFFGNYDDNRWQYNLAAFDLREKDTDSELNTLDERNQRVLVANVFKQDFIWPGYTAEWSLLANLDNGGTHYDDNGFLVRPEPLGTVREHSVDVYYAGWGGDGHIGRINVSHQFYEAFGSDQLNGLAGHQVNVNAQMAAVELSYDQDWVRYKASIFYASGDHNPTGKTASGFDTVLDNPNFTGGPFSYWVRQGINLGGTSVNLKQPDSLVPDLRSSKTEGQANFVNPGVFIPGVGTEIELTPKLRLFANANYIRFVDTDSVKSALLTDKVDRDIGWDLSIGFQYRPLLTDNIIISAGFGSLVPGRGFRDIYQTSSSPPPGYNPTGYNNHIDSFLYSGLFAITFTY